MLLQVILFKRFITIFIKKIKLMARYRKHRRRRRSRRTYVRLSRGGIRL